MGDAVPQTPWDLALLLTRMDAFPFTENGACRTIDLLARRIGQRRDATRAPMQVRNGRRPHGRLLRQQPALYLRTAVFLSKQPGPPQWSMQTVTTGSDTPFAQTLVPSIAAIVIIAAVFILRTGLSPG